MSTVRACDGVPGEAPRSFPRRFALPRLSRKENPLFSGAVSKAREKTSEYRKNFCKYLRRPFFPVDTGKNGVYNSINMIPVRRKMVFRKRSCMDPEKRADRNDFICGKCKDGVIGLYFRASQRAGGSWKAGTRDKPVSLPSSIPESAC